MNREFYRQNCNEFHSTRGTKCFVIIAIHFFFYYKTIIVWLSFREMLITIDETLSVL